MKTDNLHDNKLSAIKKFDKNLNEINNKTNDISNFKLEKRIKENEKLGRKLAVQGAREMEAYFEFQGLRASNLIKESYKSSRLLYKDRCRAIQEAFNESIYFKKKADNRKKLGTQFYCWGASNDRIGLFLISVPYKPLEIDCIKLMTVSIRAAHRILMHLNTTDIRKVQEELTTCAATTISLIHNFYVPKNLGKSIENATSHGRAIIKPNARGPVVIETWKATNPATPNNMTFDDVEMLEQLLPLVKNNLPKRC